MGTGDCGVVQNLPVANSQCGDASHQPDTSAWDDSPWVTAVGGTVPNINPKTGAKEGSDPVWHVAGIFSEGAGYSSVFTRPGYQNGEEMPQMTNSEPEEAEIRAPGMGDQPEAREIPIAATPPEE